MFSDDLCIKVWNSFFMASNLPIPPRDTGIMSDWRLKWKGANDFRGAPLGPEYPVVIPGNNHAGVAQNYAGGTCVWDLVTNTANWL